jgi:hypothetical protein
MVAVKKAAPVRYTLNEAAAELGKRGYRAREDAQGKEAIREQAVKNLKKARDRRWAV